MKKILFVINSLGIGGAERVLVDDINEFVRRGDFSVSLLTLRGETEKTFANELLLPRSLWKIIPVRNLFDFFGFFKVLDFIRKEKPDAIVSHLWYANTIVKVIGFLIRFPNVITFEQNVYDTIKSKKSFFLDRVLQRFSRKIIAVSQTVKESLIRHGIRKNKIEVLYNSVNVEKFSKQHHLEKLVPEVEGTTKFLFVGRLIPQKNVDILIKAFRLVPNSTLYIVGQGYLLEELKLLVQEQGLLEKVFFLGVRNDIPALMQFCDCFVLPSRYEGFSLVLLEAMAGGMPIIVSDFSANKEIIVDGENGLFVSQDEESIARACRKLVQDSNLRKQIGIEARKKACDFSIQNHVDTLVKLI